MAAASTASATASEWLLSTPPKDGVTALAFAPVAASESLLVSSWDGSVSLHSARSGSQLVRCQFEAPVLACCWQSATAGLSCGLDHAVRLHDFAASEPVSHVVGTHAGAVKSVCWSQAHGIIVSASWDRTVQCWDPRTPAKAVSSLSLPGKAFGMDVCSGGAGSADAVVCATEGRRLVTVDLRAPGTAADDRESSLKRQLRCVAAMPPRRADAARWGNGGQPGVAVGSIEGRAALEYLDPRVTGGEGCSNFGFKCHRVESAAGAVAHPVNAIAFNKRHGTFVTGGGDGVTTVWDGMARKRVGKPSAAYPTSVSALAFSEDSDLLAVAVSYAFEAGDVEHPPDQVHVRAVHDSQIQPRAPKSKK